MGVRMTLDRRVKNSGGFTFEVLLIRWVAERAFAWLSHDRRLSKDDDRRTDFAEEIKIYI